jgi:hypothetical protein
MPSTSRRRRSGANRQQRAPASTAERGTEPAAKPRGREPTAPPAAEPVPVQAPSGGDPARRHRLAAGVVLLLAPAAVLAGQVALLPVSGPGSGLGAIAEDLDAWRAGYALLLASSVLTVPMVLALDHLLRRRGYGSRSRSLPLWADAGSTMAIVGAIAAIGIALIGFVVAELAAGAPAGGGQADALLDRLRPLFGALDLTEDLLLLGMVLLALGLYRHAAVPAAAALLLLTGLALSWGPSALRLAAAALQLAGLGWLAVTVLRWPDRHWADPPVFPLVRRPTLVATLLTLLYVLGVASVARFLALVAVFLALVVYRQAPATAADPAAEGGTDAGHPP